MSGRENATGSWEDYQQGIDVVDGVKEDMDGPDILHRGNTVRLASLFGDVKVTSKRQDREIKVITVTRREDEQSSDSDSDAEQGKTKTTVVRVTKSTKSHRRGHANSRGSSSSSSSSNSSEDENNAEVEKKTITVVKKQLSNDQIQDVKDSKKERNVSKITKVVATKDVSGDTQVVAMKKAVLAEIRDSSSERERKTKAKEMSMDKKNMKQVTIVKKTSRIESSDSSSSDDEARNSKKVISTTKVVSQTNGGHKEQTRKAMDNKEDKHVMKQVKVVKTTVNANESDSSSSEDEKTTAKKQVVTMAKFINRGDEAQKKETLKAKEKKDIKQVTVVKKQVALESSDSSSSEDERRHAKKEVTASVKVVKQKVEGHEEKTIKGKDTKKVGKKQVVIVKKTSAVEIRDSSSSEDEKRTEKKNVVAMVKLMNQADQGHKETKVKAKTSKNESKSTKQVTVVKRTTKIERSDSSSSSDDEQGIEKKHVVTGVKLIKQSANDQKQGQAKEKVKREKVKIVKKNVSDSSSDSESEGEKTSYVVTKKVAVTKLNKDTKESSDDQMELSARKEEHKTQKIIKRDSSSSDSEEEKRRTIVKVSKVEMMKRELEERGHIKSKAKPQHRSSSSEEERKPIKETKAVKITKVVRKTHSSSSDDEGVKPEIVVTQVNVVKQEHEIKKKVLVVSAHVFKESYEGALFRAAVKSLKREGAKIQTSNLHEMAFDPVASPEEFRGSTKGSDVVAEQDKVQWADTILIMCRIQNHGLPAILKGWLDRILRSGFAYTEDAFYEKGLLKGKKALLCMTSAGTASMYSQRGIHGDLDVYLWPILNGILRFAGFDVLKPQVYFSVDRDTDLHLTHAIDSLQQRLQHIWSEKPLEFIPSRRFREKRGFELSGRSMAELHSEGKLTVAQYVEKTPGGMAVVMEPEVSDDVYQRKMVN